MPSEFPDLESGAIGGSSGSTSSGMNSLYGFSIGNRIPFISYHHLKLIRSIGLELSKCYMNLAYSPFLPNLETGYYPRIDNEQVETLILMIQEMGCNEDIFKQLFEMCFDLLKSEITQPFDEIHVLFLKLLTCMICKMNQPPQTFTSLNDIDDDDHLFTNSSGNGSGNVRSGGGGGGSSTGGNSTGGNANSPLSAILYCVDNYLLKTTKSSPCGTSDKLSNLKMLTPSNNNTIQVEDMYSRALFNSFMLFIQESIQKYSKTNLMIAKEMIKSLLLILNNNIVLFAINSQTYSLQWLFDLFKNTYKEAMLYDDWLLAQYAIYGLSKTYAILHSNNSRDVVNEDYMIKVMETSLVNSHTKQSACQSILSFIECNNRNIVLKLLPYLASNIQGWLLEKEQTVYNQLLLLKMITLIVQQYPEASVHQLTKKTMEALFNLSDDIDAPLSIVITIFKSLQNLLMNYSLSQFERSLIEAMTSIKQSASYMSSSSSTTATGIMMTNTTAGASTTPNMNHVNSNHLIATTTTLQNTSMMSKIVHPFKKMTIDTSTFSNFTQMLAQNRTILLVRKPTAAFSGNSSSSSTPSSNLNTTGNSSHTKTTNVDDVVASSKNKSMSTSSSTSSSSSSSSGGSGNSSSGGGGGGGGHSTTPTTNTTTPTNNTIIDIKLTPTSSSTTSQPNTTTTTATTKMKQFMSFFQPKKNSPTPTTAASSGSSGGGSGGNTNVSSSSGYSTSGGSSGGSGYSTSGGSSSSTLSKATTTPSTQHAPTKSLDNNITLSRSGSVSAGLSSSMSSTSIAKSISMTSIASAVSRSAESLQNNISQTRRILLLGLMATFMYTSTFSGNNGSMIISSQDSSQKERAKVNILHLIEQFHDGEIDREGEVLLRFIPQLMEDFFESEQILPLLYNEFLSAKTHPLLLSLLLSLHMPHICGKDSTNQQNFENWINMSMQTLCLKQPPSGALWALLCLFITVCMSEYDHHHAALIYFGSNHCVHEWNQISSHAFLLYGSIFYNYLCQKQMKDAIKTFSQVVLPQLIEDCKGHLIYVKLLKTLKFLCSGGTRVQSNNSSNETMIETTNSPKQSTKDSLASELDSFF
nr:unnamed protein product [Naegleria fowleri]